MLNIECFTLGPLATNAWLLTNPGTGRAVVIDPGVDPGPLLERVRDLKVEAILLTHAHFDHIGGVEELRRMKGCPVYIHPAEAGWLTDPILNGSAAWPELGPPVVTDPAEHGLEDGQELHLMGEVFRVFHTPGHSPGSVSYLWQDKLFSGDVLFRLSVGRTDFPGGNHRQLMESIHGVLFRLPPGTEVFPGHGPRTTIGFEMEHNPFV